MRLDRAFQKELLNILAARYPKHLGQGKLLGNLAEWLNANMDESFRPKGAEEIYAFAEMNLSYLQEHGLIAEEVVGSPLTGAEISLGWKISAKGLDFLQDDGGLSAILNTVTVKFDVNNMRSLVAEGLLQAQVPQEQQGALKKAIKEAPATILQTAISTIVGKGLSDPAGTAKAVAGLFGITWE